jgi:hypothetical protein
MTMPPRPIETELTEEMWLELEDMRSEEDRDFEEMRLRRDALAADEASSPVSSPLSDTLPYLPRRICE